MRVYMINVEKRKLKCTKGIFSKEAQVSCEITGATHDVGIWGPSCCQHTTHLTTASWDSYAPDRIRTFKSIQEWNHRWRDQFDAVNMSPQILMRSFSYDWTVKILLYRFTAELAGSNTQQSLNHKTIPTGVHSGNYLHVMPWLHIEDE